MEIGVEGAILMLISTTSFTPAPTGNAEICPLNENLPSEPVGVTTLPFSVPPNQTAKSVSLPSSALIFE